MGVIIEWQAAKETSVVVFLEVPKEVKFDNLTFRVQVCSQTGNVI